MKNIALLLFAVILLVSCAKDNEPQVFKVDIYATVNIKPAAGVRSAMEGHLSALDIVKKATAIRLDSYDVWGNIGNQTRGFEKAQRDTLSSVPCLKMWGTDVIREDGKMDSTFIDGKDIVLEVWNGFDVGVPYDKSRVDTIAYIPNSVIRVASVAIKTAYRNGDSETVYRLFKDAFTFIPITGSEYRELKSKGLN